MPQQHDRRPRPPGAGDAGVTLIEVVVAMFVLAVITTGIIGGVTITQRMTPDNEAREVAAGLASQEIDLVRATGDPYQVGPRTLAQTINGRTYTVERDTGWVTPSGAQAACGYTPTRFELAVNVSVTWGGQSSTTASVRSDTVLAPNSTITDAKTGAMAIKVAASDGSPQEGVAVSVAVSPTNPNGAVAPSAQPPATGVDGCSYLGKLVPGNYLVTVGSGGQAAPSQTVSVAAGATTTRTFTFDGQATLVRADASNTDGDAMIPNDLVVSYLNSTAPLYSDTAASVTVHPYAAGYTAVAGKLGPNGGAVTCAEYDPAAWGAGTSNGKSVGSGARAAASAPKNGKSRPIQVPMATVTLTGMSGEWVSATQAAPAGSGNPGCASRGATVHFDQVSDDPVELALPYGTWTLFSGSTAASQTVQVGAAAITATSNAAGGGIAVDGTVTLDPRPLR